MSFAPDGLSTVFFFASVQQPDITNTSEWKPITTQARVNEGPDDRNADSGEYQ